MSGSHLRRMLLLILLVQPGVIVGQEHASGKADAGWTLRPREPLRPGVDLWPLVVAPRNAATDKVNAMLRQMNDDAVAAVHQCDDDWATFQQASGKKRGRAEKGDWDQKIKVTMNGPRFLSFTTIQFNYCGGAYPNTDRLAFVFDLQSGESVDWLKHMGETAHAGRFGDEFSVPALQEINSHFAVGDCKNAFEGEQDFLIWPDARRERLVALATGLPHVIQGCAREIALTMEQARKMGFDEDVLGAIEEAHRRSVGAARRGPTH